MGIQPLFIEQFQGTTPGEGGVVTNQDDANSHPEDNITLPWCVSPDATYLDYRCHVEIQLDPGTVLHKPLPQQAWPVDTLGSISIAAPEFFSAVNGVNMNSASGAEDVIQRMASSTYVFVLRGWGMRAGYQIPIPSLLKIGTADAVPTNPQTATQEIVGNLMGGIPVWYAVWELYYLVATAPKIARIDQQPIPPNPAFAVRPDAELPKFVRVPRMPADQNAVAAGTPTGVAGGIGNFVRR